MQTFLPYPDFAASAAALDRQRLGKQRVEVVQLLRAIRGYTRGWRNHPAARMWRGFEPALCAYGLAVCDEWVARGYNDRCAVRIRRFQASRRRVVLPPWVGDERFHSAHRSNLLRKDPAWYGRHGWDDDPAAPYWWPAGVDKKRQRR